MIFDKEKLSVWLKKEFKKYNDNASEYLKNDELNSVEEVLNAAEIITNFFNKTINAFVEEENIILNICFSHVFNFFDKNVRPELDKNNYDPKIKIKFIDGCPLKKN